MLISIVVFSFLGRPQTVGDLAGYRPNGDFVHDGGELGPRTGQSFTLERATWEPRRRADIELVGVDACRPLLGA